MSEAKHSPLPWTVHEVSPHAKKDNRRWLVNPDVAVCNDPANAQHIVRCVNAHDDLLEALVETYNLMVTYMQGTAPTIPPLVERASVMGHAEAAIAKATED